MTTAAPADAAAVGAPAAAPPVSYPAQQVLVALKGLGLSAPDPAPATQVTVAMSRGADTPSGPQPAGSPVLRAVTIQLDPEHLGLVSIKMRMVAGQIDIHIDVANGQTLDLLEKDRHVLTDAVAAAGGRPDSLVLRTLDASTGAAGGSSSPPGEAQQHGFDTMASPGGQREQRSAPPIPPTLETGTAHDETAPTPTVDPRRVDRGLYV